jgi:hypothetical protein
MLNKSDYLFFVYAYTFPPSSFFWDSIPPRQRDIKYLDKLSAGVDNVTDEYSEC